MYAYHIPRNYIRIIIAAILLVIINFSDKNLNKLYMRPLAFLTYL